MSAKNNLLTFIEMIFNVSLIALFIVYFIVGDRVGIFYEIITRAWPLIAMLCISFIKFKYNRRIYTRKLKEDDAEIVLYLDYMDKIVADLLLYGIPTIILFIPMIIKNDIALEDILQAAISFILLYYYQYRIFKKIA
jgi:hypothetical protein